MSGTPRVLGWPAFRHRASQPYTALLYEHLRGLGAEVAEYSAARALTGRFDVLHLHWPERRVRAPRAVDAAARSAALLALLAAVRRLGTRVVWTVHNLKAHEGTYRPWLEPAFWRAFARRVDALIALSPAGMDGIRNCYPEFQRTPAYLIPHGHYRGAYPDTASRDEARAALGLGPYQRVLCFVGQIREYKNVDRLVRVARALPDPDLALVVAGSPKTRAVENAVRAAAAHDPRMRLFLRFIPEEEMQLYLRSSDLVVLPYRDILNSGSAILALSFDRPVLVPALGGMADLARQIGAEWVHTYEGELTTAALRGALAAAREMPRDARAPLDPLDWTTIAEQTLRVYEEVAQGRRRRA